jgi:hypothetical protein
MQPQNKSSIATALALLISLLVLPSTTLHAGGRRRAVAVSLPSSELTLTFLDGAIVDAGPVIWRGEKRKATSVTRTATLRIGRASQEPRGTATLRAFLETSDAHTIVRVNGILLGTAPRVVQRHAPIGIASTVRIEIEVPVSAPQGPLTASIGWEVTTD